MDGNSKVSLEAAVKFMQPNELLIASHDPSHFTEDSETTEKMAPLCQNPGYFTSSHLAEEFEKTQKMAYPYQTRGYFTSSHLAEQFEATQKMAPPCQNRGYFTSSHLAEQFEHYYQEQAQEPPISTNQPIPHRVQHHGHYYNRGGPGQSWTNHPIPHRVQHPGHYYYGEAPRMYQQMPPVHYNEGLRGPSLKNRPMAHHVRRPGHYNGKRQRPTQTDHQTMPPPNNNQSGPQRYSRRGRMPDERENYRPSKRARTDDSPYPPAFVTNQR